MLPSPAHTRRPRPAATSRSLALAGTLLLAACGAKEPTTPGATDGATLGVDLSEPETGPAKAPVQIVVDGELLEEGQAVRFAASYELPVDLELGLHNDSAKGLELLSVLFDFDATGELKSGDVSLEWAQNTGPDDLPVPIAEGHTVTLDVSAVYTPGPGGVPTDPRESQLRFELSGDEGPLSIVLPVQTPSLEGVPGVDPPEWVFSEAHFTADQSQVFTLRNSGTEPYTVFWIEREESSLEYVFTPPNKPLPLEVWPDDDPSHHDDVQFLVTYKPGALDQSENAILFGSSAQAEPVRVPLSAEPLPGSYTIALDPPGPALDFADAVESTQLVATVNSLGPGPIAVGFPSLAPDSVLGWLDVESQVDFDGWPVILAPGETIGFYVLYEGAAAAGTDTLAELRVPIEAPWPGEALVDVYWGDARPSFRLMPTTVSSVVVTAAAASGQAGSRRVVIGNPGTASLTVDSVAVGGVGPFTLSSPWPSTVVNPHNLAPVELAWSADAIPEGSAGLSQTLDILWVDDASGEEHEEILVLFAKDLGDKVAPTGAITSEQDLGALDAGQTVLLDASGTDDGDFELSGDEFLWFLSDRPVGSRARLDMVAGPWISFVPDAIGTYRIELLVFAEDATGFVYSEPVSVELEVVE